MKTQKIKTELNPYPSYDFVTYIQLTNYLKDIGIEPKFLKIHENHRSAYGIHAFQIIEIDINSADKFNKIS
jgi:hypothetical protein